MSLSRCQYSSTQPVHRWFASATCATFLLNCNFFEIHQTEKLEFLGTNSNQSKISIWICTARYRGIWVSRFDGLREWSILSANCHIFISCIVCKSQRISKDISKDGLLLHIYGYRLQIKQNLGCKSSKRWKYPQNLYVYKMEAISNICTALCTSSMYDSHHQPVDIHIYTLLTWWGVDSALQWVAVGCSVRHDMRVAVCCSVLQCVAVCDMIRINNQSIEIPIPSSHVEVRMRMYMFKTHV